MSDFLLIIFFLQLSFSISLLLVQVQSGTLPSDIKALQALKSSVDPSSVPSYACLASWNFSTDPCLLPRRTHFTCAITCSPDSTRVVSLVLDPVGYSGRLSPLVSLLTQLITLDLSDNSFSGPLPFSLSSLSNLQNLVLRSNSFSGFLPPSLTALKSLQILDVSGNSLTGALPSSMASLSSLRRLDLSFNKFTGGLPSKLPPNLVELAIKANSLSGSLLLSSFEGLTQLEVVELSANSFTGALQSWFFLLPAIQQVNLANNSFTRVDVPKADVEGSDLVAVDLSFNSIEGNLPVNFVTFPVLSSLALRYNKLRGPIPLEYSKKYSLKRLYLDGNYLNGKPPGGLFSGNSTVAGSIGDNCLQGCPSSSQLCTPLQKPTSACRQAYGGKPRS